MNQAIIGETCVNNQRVSEKLRLINLIITLRQKNIEKVANFAESWLLFCQQGKNNWLLGCLKHEDIDIILFNQKDCNHQFCYLQP